MFEVIKKYPKKPDIATCAAEKNIARQVENIWAETLKRRLKLFKITKSAIMGM